MDRADWLQWRREGVTATEVAKATTGYYGGMLSVLADKRATETGEANASMNRGLAWEDTITAAAEHLIGVHIVGEQMMVECESDRRWRATIDGLASVTPETTFSDAIGIVEIKTRAPHVKPAVEYWTAQVQWQMLVTGKRQAWIVEAVIVGGETDDPGVKLGACEAIRVRHVEADPTHQAVLVDAAERIWQHLQDGTTPPPVTGDDLDAVKVLTAAHTPGAEPVDLADLEADIARFDALKAAEKELKAERDLIEARLRHAVADRTVGVAAGWKVTVAKPRRVLTDAGRAILGEMFPNARTVTVDVDTIKRADKAAYESVLEPIGARTITVRRGQ
jgi:predicted phage-related endonuclease